MKEVNKRILAKTLCLLEITKNTYPVVHSEFYLLRHLKTAHPPTQLLCELVYGSHSQVQGMER